MTIRNVLLAGTIVPALVGANLGEATPLAGLPRLQLAQAGQEPADNRPHGHAPGEAPAQQRPVPSLPKAEPRLAPEAPRAAPALRAEPPAGRIAPQAPKVAPQAPNSAPQAPRTAPAAESSRPAIAPTPDNPVRQSKPEAVHPNVAKPPAPSAVAPEAPRPVAPVAPAAKAPAVAPTVQAPKPAAAQPAPATPTAPTRPSPALNGGAANPAVRTVAPAAAAPGGLTPAQAPVQRSAAPSPAQPVPHAQPQPANQPATPPGGPVRTAPNSAVAPAQPVPGQPAAGRPAAGQAPAGQPVAGRPAPAVSTPTVPTTPTLQPSPPAAGGPAQPAVTAPGAAVPPGPAKPTAAPGQATPAAPQPVIAPGTAPGAAPASGQAQPATHPPQQPGTTGTGPASPGQVQGQRRDGGNGTGVAIGAAAGLVGGFLAAQGLQHLDEVRSRRQEYDENGVDYVREPGRTIVRENDRYFVAHDENERFRDLGYAVRTERQGADNLAIYDRPDGVQILTYTTDDGRLIRRVRRFPDGRQVVLIDNGPDGPRRRYDQDVIVLPPPPLDIPQDRYIVDANDADESLLADTLAAPPVEPIGRRYTLDEVRYSPTLRARMRSVDLNTINFETGSWTVTPDQAGHLKAIAQAIGQAITRNPQEIFLIEGYTDAVGQDVDNLSLSDRRAQAVATILTTNFQIPPENLTTQGYGAQNLKEPTRGPSAINRRVTARRITPLIAGGTPPR